MSTTIATPTLDLLPSDEETAIRAAVRGICDQFGDGYARECYENGRPPTELWNALAQGGYTGVNVAEEWGGGGLGMSGLVVVGEETAAAGVGLLMLVVSSAIAGSILAGHGSEAQKERWLRGIAAGTTKLAFAITEPDAGSNAHNLRTELRRNGESYRLSGQKVFISGVETSDAILVVARHRKNGQLTQPCLCIVDTDAPGLRRDAIRMPYLGPDHQWQLFFDDVEIGADRLVGGEQGGLSAVFDGLNPERIMVAALGIGTGRRALDKACTYARQRSVWKVPIGSHQAIAQPLAKAKIELELARLMTQKAAALFDTGAAGVGEASNMAKYAAAEAAVHCVDQSVQTHGGNGIALEYGVSDLWWFARLMRTAPVSAEMVLNYVAQHTLELPRSY